MLHLKPFLKAVIGTPLVNFQRASVRYRLRMTEPDDSSTRLHREKADDSQGTRKCVANDCETRP
jgi:hypothetical protein